MKRYLLPITFTIAIASSAAVLAQTSNAPDSQRGATTSQDGTRTPGGHATHSGADYTKHQLDDARSGTSGTGVQRGAGSMDGHATHSGADYTKHQLDDARQGGSRMDRSSRMGDRRDPRIDESPQTSGQAGYRSIGDGTMWP